MNTIKKAISITLIFIIGLSMNVVNASAEGKNKEIGEQINETVEIYFMQIGVNSLEDLNCQETKQLLNKVDEIKLHSPEIQETIKRDSENANISLLVEKQRAGYILVTGDAQTSSFAHGRAGIVAETDGGTIEAQNHQKGIVKENFRIQTYWSKKNSSMMGVVGATDTNYDRAFSYARTKVGFGYELLPVTKEMYCSELVYYAWKEAGIPLYHHTVGFILPSAIYSSSKTYTVRKWESGF